MCPVTDSEVLLKETKRSVCDSADWWSSGWTDLVITHVGWVVFLLAAISKPADGRIVKRSRKRKTIRQQSFARKIFY